MKQIVYTCTDSGITPSVPQKAGVQGDCEVTEIILDVTAVTLPDTPLFRIEVADGSGHFTAYTDLTVTDDVIDEATHKRVHFLVPLAVTDAGGMATMHLVISNETEVMYTYPAMLSFKGSTYGSDTRLDYTHDMSDMLQYASNLIGGYQGALLGKVDKVEGKGLSTNDYTDSDKELVQTIPNKVDKEEGKGLSSNDYTNADKELVQSIPNKANTSDVNSALDGKVDKIPGKGLSTNDYTNIDQMMVQTISGKANVVTVNQQLAGKVDKVEGKQLSTNDYTNSDKELVQTITNKAPASAIELTNEDLYSLASSHRNALYFANNGNTCTNKPEGVHGFTMFSTRFGTMLVSNDDAWVLDRTGWRRLVVSEELDLKQDKLTAGSNITIVDNVISATGGGGGSGAVDDVKVDGVSVVSSGIANIDLSNKVDKVAGKGLSTNDYTTTEKNKVAIIGDIRSLPSGYNDIISWILAEVFDAQTVGSIQAQIDKNRADHNKMEIKENKVTAMSEESTDDQYPSAKAVYDLFNSIVNGNEVAY